MAYPDHVHPPSALHRYDTQVRSYKVIAKPYQAYISVKIIPNGTAKAKLGGFIAEIRTDQQAQPNYT